PLPYISTFFPYTTLFRSRDAGIVDFPHFRTLILRIPRVAGIAERENPFLGTRLLLIASCSAERGVEPVSVESLPESHRLHDMRRSEEHTSELQSRENLVC